MKKLITVLFVFTGFVMFGQKFSFGIKAGVNYSNVISDYPKDVAPIDINTFYKPGFQIGGFTEMKISEKFSLQGELLYLNYNYGSDFSYGYNQDSSENILFDTLEDLESKNSALSIPIVFKYYFIDKLALQFGPQFDYTFKEKGTRADYVGDSGAGDSWFEKGDFVKGEYSENINEFSWGLDVGLGYDLNEKMGLEFRYNYGFDKDNESYNTTLNNSIFQLNFQYKF